jgi:carboxymethylenebutenolidase
MVGRTGRALPSASAFFRKELVKFSVAKRGEESGRQEVKLAEERATHPVKDATVRLQVSDGTQMNAYIARPKEGKPHPGLLVFQEAFGVNAHIRDVTSRFAVQGFVAIAPELFHRTAPPGFEGSYSDFASVTPHMKAMTNEGAIADCRAAFDWVRVQTDVSSNDISSIGYCMGGRISFLANSVLPLKRAVSYYGGNIAPALLDRAALLHGPMLFFWGGLDKHIPPEQREQVIDSLKQNGKKYVNVEISDADHAFFCDARPAYNARASQLAWALTLEFLK